MKSSDVLYFLWYKQFYYTTLKQKQHNKQKQTKLSTELITCKAILKSGKRKDMECGSKVTDGQFWCKRHLPK